MTAKRALVVGASGGIGASLTKIMRAQGAVVIEVSRSIDDFDVTDPNKVQEHMESLEGAFDTVLIATGILAPPNVRPEKSLTEIDAANMAHVMAVNAIGPALVLRHIPKLLPRDTRSVVGVLTARVGSIGDNQLGGWYSYRAAKAAANQIVHTAALEIARSRKKSVVVALHPGTVETRFTEAYPTQPKVSTDEAATNLITVIGGLAEVHNGCFFDWAGKPVPW